VAPALDEITGWTDSKKKEKNSGISKFAKTPVI
jgi:hypothetical protein